MSWLEEMKRDAVALVDPDLVLTEHMEISVDMNYDDWYDPTFGDCCPTYTIEVSVFDLAKHRYVLNVSYTDKEAADFWLDLMKAGSK